MHNARYECFRAICNLLTLTPFSLAQPHASHHSAVFAIISMAMNSANLVIAMGIFALISSGTAAWQRSQLMKLETLREVINKVRQEVNRLQIENNQLTATNTELEQQVDKVKEVEKGLNDVLTAQGEQVDTFVQTVKENQEILDKIKKKLEAKISQDILSVVMQSDRDGDFTIDPNEIDILVLRLKNAQGVELEEEKFKQMLKDGGYHVSTVLNILKDMMDSDKKEEDKVVHINTKDIKPGDI